MPSIVCRSGRNDSWTVLAAISHHRRTALTRLKLRAEYIDDPQQRIRAVADPDEMQMMVEEARRFARDDAALEARSPMDLAVMLQGLCEDHGDAGAVTEYQAPDHLSCECQPAAMWRAFANPVDNALRYGGQACVSLSATHPEVQVVIADSPAGGIPRSRNGRHRPGPYPARETLRRPGGGPLVHAILPRGL